MPTLTGTFDLQRCPHCKVAQPRLALQHQLKTNNSSNNRQRHWGIYVCGNCGGVVTAYGIGGSHEAQEWFPAVNSVPNEVPERPRTFLSQAQESLHAPSGAVMLAASSVDSMLKARGLTEGSLYARIERAAKDHLITQEMSEWAHAIRLDANDQRHADENAPLPTEADARRCIDFASALGEILFTLPARVSRGLSADV